MNQTITINLSEEEAEEILELYGVAYSEGQWSRGMAMTLFRAVMEAFPELASKFSWL
jgi:hypothetical protein